MPEDWLVRCFFPCENILRTRAGRSLRWRAWCSLVVWGVWYRISNKQTNNTFLEQIQPYINMTGAVRAPCFPGCVLMYTVCAWSR